MGGYNEGALNKVRQSGPSGMRELQGLAQKIDEMNWKSFLQKLQIANKAIPLVFLKSAVGIRVGRSDLQQILFWVYNAAHPVFLDLPLPWLWEDEADSLEEVSGLLKILKTADCTVQHD